MHDVHKRTEQRDRVYIKDSAKPKVLFLFIQCEARQKITIRETIASGIPNHISKQK